MSGIYMQPHLRVVCKTVCLCHSHSFPHCFFLFFSFPFFPRVRRSANATNNLLLYGRGSFLTHKQCRAPSLTAFQSEARKEMIHML